MWVRLLESQIKDSGPMLPGRVVLEFREPDGSYRTFLETFPRSGEPQFSYGRYFDWEAAATEDYWKRVARL